jgi:hypothetical protein
VANAMEAQVHLQCKKAGSDCLCTDHQDLWRHLQHPGQGLPSFSCKKPTGGFCPIEASCRQGALPKWQLRLIWH